MTIVLRPLEVADSAQVLAWRNSETVAPYMYTSHRIEPDEHARWLEAVIACDAKRYWIVEWDDRPVGLANVVGIDRERSRCEWAYYLADPATRGRGVGACVEYLVLRHVFEGLGLHKLWCEVFVENEGVWRLHESFGFRREASFRGHVRKDGRYFDVLGLGLLAEEWPAAKAKAEARLSARGFEPVDLALVDPLPIFWPQTAAA